ncbi:hypothetical protein BDA99DRAFT_502589 [Phascolomyces articulosus]|uniref:Uncharacterized protein n=1 Tax=Phascolomyces articulosus TaxID=60185 RepID=A0AAD5KHI4_9FUNG|nr:hypothetical protein BDA99DRAFT_502589 [Phascolomyces articulosus]
MALVNHLGTSLYATLYNDCAPSLSLELTGLYPILILGGRDQRPSKPFGLSLAESSRRWCSNNFLVIALLSTMHIFFLEK